MLCGGGGCGRRRNLLGGGRGVGGGGLLYLRCGIFGGVCAGLVGLLGGFC